MVLAENLSHILRGAPEFVHCVLKPGGGSVRPSQFQFGCRKIGLEEQGLGMLLPENGADPPEGGPKRGYRMFQALRRTVGGAGKVRFGRCQVRECDQGLRVIGSKLCGQPVGCHFKHAGRARGDLVSPRHVLAQAPGFLPPFGHRHPLPGHPVPARDLGLPHGRLTGHHPAPGPGRGFHVFTPARYDRGGCPLYPGDGGPPPGKMPCPAGAARG
jgi:hypothetical protein